MEKKIIQIKNRWTGKVIFEYEKTDNTVKDTVVAAVKNGANLEGAYLYGANLKGAKNIPYIPLACPSDGAFIGWKKVEEDHCDYLVKLEIPEDARRSSAATRKCRCDKAKVLEIRVMMRTDDGKPVVTDEAVQAVTNHAYGQDTPYIVGEMVYPDNFDENRWDECSNGIHFFINKQDAIDY